MQGGFREGGRNLITDKAVEEASVIVGSLEMKLSNLHVKAEVEDGGGY